MKKSLCIKKDMECVLMTVISVIDIKAGNV